MILCQAGRITLGVQVPDKQHYRSQGYEKYRNTAIKSGYNLPLAQLVQSVSNRNRGHERFQRLLGVMRGGVEQPLVPFDE